MLNVSASSISSWAQSDIRHAIQLRRHFLGGITGQGDTTIVSNETAQLPSQSVTDLRRHRKVAVYLLSDGDQFFLHHLGGLFFLFDVHLFRKPCETAGNQAVLGDLQDFHPPLRIFQLLVFFRNTRD